jgi:tetratricopeptide (TPR) repeat protein
MPRTAVARRDAAQEQAGRRRVGALGSWLALAVAIPVAAWVFAEAQRHARADLASAGARKAVAVWVSGERWPPSREALDDARADIERAVRIEPDNPALQEALGNAYLALAQFDWSDVSARRAHLERAAAQYQRVITLRPAAAQSWAALASLYAALGESKELLRQTWERALSLGPNESYVQPMLLQTALAVWADASPRMQQWAKDRFENGTEAQRRAINQMAKAYGLEFESDRPPRR